MENLRKLSDEEILAKKDLANAINQLAYDACVSLPLTVTNALETFELKIDKEISRREL